MKKNKKQIEQEKRQLRKLKVLEYVLQDSFISDTYQPRNIDEIYQEIEYLFSERIINSRAKEIIIELLCDMYSATLFELIKNDNIDVCIR